MKFISPKDKAAPTSPGGGLDWSKYTPGRPQWMREWIEDQHHYVMLVCGHKDDITRRGMLIIKALLGTNRKSQYDVFCETCNDFKRVKRNMGKLEYLGITPAEIPDVPLF